VSVFVLSPLRITAPLAAARWQAGGFRGVHTVCEEIGDDAVVLFASDQDAWRPLMTPIRALCDVPVLRTSGEDPATGTLAEVERVARSDGRSLWVLARTEEDLRMIDPEARNVQRVTVYDTTRLQPTLNRPPNELVPHHLEVAFSEVEP